MNNVLNFLVGTLGYSQTNTKILLDDDKHPQPTKAGIVSGSFVEHFLLALSWSIIVH